MQNLTTYSDDELSLVVFNTEYLYNVRNDRPYLMELLEEGYTFTDEQMGQLVIDLDEDQEDEQVRTTQK